jgi:hypothetical protein
MARRQLYEHLQKPLNPGAPAEPEVKKEEVVGPDGETLVEYVFDDDTPEVTEARDDVQVHADETSAPPDPKDTEAEAISLLKKQYEVSENARRAAESRAQTAERDRIQALEHARQAHERTGQVEAENVTAHMSALDSAIEATRIAANQAEQHLVNAHQAGDAAEIARAQRALSQAEIRINELSQGKAALDVRKTQPRPAPAAAHVAQSQSADPFESWASQLSPRSQTYVRSRQNKITSGDSAYNVDRLTAVHGAAVRKGYSPDSDAYFEFIDKEMGYGPKMETPASAAPVEAPAVKAASKTSAPPAAPVSRSGGGAASDSRVRLTAEQREFCRTSGLDEQEYARNIMTINKNKDNPSWAGPRWYSGR